MGMQENPQNKGSGSLVSRPQIANPNLPVFSEALQTSRIVNGCYLRESLGRVKKNPFKP